MKGIRLYKMVLSTGWYDEDNKRPVTHESYYQVARKGKIKTVKKSLTKRGLKHFQQSVYRFTKHWPRKHRVRVSFERIMPVTKSDKHIQIQTLSMEKKNGQWSATRLPSRILTYIKRRRKR